jgi:type II secretory pathway component GspD/PulD (secretin)
MKKIITLLTIFVFLIICFNPGYPQSAKDKESKPQETEPKELKPQKPEPEKTLSEKMEKKISLDLRGMEIIDTLNFLAKQGDLNVAATNNVKGRVTLFLKNVTIKDMFDMILLTNDLAMSIDNNVITIMTNSEYEALYGEKYIDKREAETVQIKYADPETIGTILADIKSTIGKVIVDSATATVLMMDTPKKIEKMKQAVKKVDIPTVKRVIPTETKTFELDYATVADIEEEISAVLEENVGSLRTDTRTNTLVVTALSHNMEKIEKLIKAFDTQTKSVFIDAQILELTLSDSYYYGIDWSKIFRSSDDLLLEGTYPFTSSGSSFMKLTMGELANNDYEATIEMLRDVGEVKIVSSPQIYVNNNQEAKFMVGTREAYVTTTTTTGEATTTTSESVEFIDVGVNLYVTPVINKKGFVKLHIKPEVSSVRDWLQTTEGNDIPIVETSNVETDVLVKDGQTIIMAGLIKESDEKTEKKLPFFGDIPFLGNVFKNVKDTKERKELIILLTPSVITGMEEQYKGSEESEKARDREREKIRQEIKEAKRREEIKKQKKEAEVKRKEEEKDSKTKTRKPEQQKPPSKQELFKKYQELGLSSEKEGNYKKAIEAYKKALKANPDSAIVHLHLSDIYLNYIVDPQKAERHFKWYKVLKQLSTIEEALDQKK